MKRKEIRNEIDKYMKEWVPVLLPGWHVEIELRDGEPCHSAECYPQWEYMKASVIFFHEEINKVPRPYIEALVIHELLHAALSQMHETPTDGETNKHEERVVTMLESALLSMKGKDR